SIVRTTSYRRRCRASASASRTAPQTTIGTKADFCASKGRLAASFAARIRCICNLMCDVGSNVRGDLKRNARNSDELLTEQGRRSEITCWLRVCVLNRTKQLSRLEQRRPIAAMRAEASAGIGGGGAEV